MTHLRVLTPHLAPRSKDLSFIRAVSEIIVCFLSLSHVILGLGKDVFGKMTSPLHQNPEVNEHHEVHTSSVAESASAEFRKK